MTYRDDHDALKNEVARLEEDLADARAKATTDEAAQRRAEELAREAHVLREQADRLEREVGALRGLSAPEPPRRAGIPPALLIGGAALVFALVMILGLVLLIVGGGPNSARHP